MHAAMRTRHEASSASTASLVRGRRRRRGRGRGSVRGRGRGRRRGRGRGSVRGRARVGLGVDALLANQKRERPSRVAPGFWRCSRMRPGSSDLVRATARARGKG